ncbi:MAG: hypothetical protein KY457_10355 [Actinobacteria bacterium]|nr:hypothetical protein [Actinomycetota bacterium]
MERKTIAAFFAAAMLATGCGGASTADQAEQPTGGGDMAMCAPGVTDCVDTVVDDQGGDGAGTRPSDDTLRETAQSLLGTAEAELPEDVRIGRRGGEQMMLTEDYVVGRFTAELDDDGTGTFRVTSVTVELERGPETFSA